MQLNNNGNVDGDGDIKPYMLMVMVMVILNLILSNHLVLILVDAFVLHSSNYFVCIRSSEPSVNLPLSTYSFTYV